MISFFLIKLKKKIDSLKKKLDALRPLPKEQLENLEEYFRIQYTFDSNRIEGNTLTEEEVEANKEGNEDIVPKSIKQKKKK